MLHCDEYFRLEVLLIMNNYTPRRQALNSPVIMVTGYTENKINLGILPVTSVNSKVI